MCLFLHILVLNPTEEDFRASENLKLSLCLLFVQMLYLAKYVRGYSIAKVHLDRREHKILRGLMTWMRGGEEHTGHVRKDVRGV